MDNLFAWEAVQREARHCSLNEQCPHRLECLNTWSPAVAQFSKVMEPLGGRVLVEKVPSPEAELEAK